MHSSSHLIQNVIVGALIATSCAYLLWRAYRAVRGRKTGCGCDSCPAIKESTPPPRHSGP